jgi:hypothetical protein
MAALAEHPCFVPYSRSHLAEVMCTAASEGEYGRKKVLSAENKIKA